MADELRTYEHVLIARQDISTQQVDALVEDLTRMIQSLGGQVGKTEIWGLRTLAYRIKKQRKGHYALLNIALPPAQLDELARRQGINEDIIRFKTIKVEAWDEEPSPILARRDREERRRARREGRDGDDMGMGDQI